MPQSKTRGVAKSPKPSKMDNFAAIAQTVTAKLSMLDVCPGFGYASESNQLISHSSEQKIKKCSQILLIRTSFFPDFQICISVPLNKQKLSLLYVIF